MTLYRALVRNLIEWEYAMLFVESPSPEDAQVAALHQAFREYGWRQSRAWPAIEVVEEDAA